MRISLRIAGALLISVLLVCASCGCSKKASRGGPVSGGEGVAPKPSLKIGGDPWSDIAAKRKALTSYEMSMDMDGQRMTHIMKLQDGKPVRMKMEMGNGGWLITLFDEKVQYMYNEKTKTAMKMPMKDQGAETPGGGSGGMKMPDMGDLKAKAPKVKSDTVDGVDCWYFEMTGPDGKVIQSWVDKEYGLPRQEKIGDKMIKFKFSNINSVPDSAFELPAGTKVQDMFQMMPGKPSAPYFTLTLPAYPPKYPATPKLPGG